MGQGGGGRNVDEKGIGTRKLTPPAPFRLKKFELDNCPLVGKHTTTSTIRKLSNQKERVFIY